MSISDQAEKSHIAILLERHNKRPEKCCRRSQYGAHVCNASAKMFICKVGRWHRDVQRADMAMTCCMLNHNVQPTAT